MDLVTLCPFVASKVVWQANSGAFALTVIVKATFVLQPGTAQLAPEQDPVLKQDRFYDHDPRRSVRVPSDMVPYKPRADVTLVGHAYAPGKQPVRSIVTRLVVGEMDKSIEVWSDRAFRVLDGQLLEGKHFTTMPLVWERASGGPESANPVGKRFDGALDAYGTIAIGNLQPLGHFVSKRSDTFAPTCYGPVAPTWPGRTQRLGRLSRHLAYIAWNTQKLPPNLDPSFFQAAPPDQYVQEIRANERVVLENLHPEYARLVTSLPGLTPRAIADRATGEREEIKLIGDTLWIDTDRGVCCVVWRGRMGLRYPQEQGRIAIWVDGMPMLESSSRTEGVGHTVDAEPDAGSTMIGFAPTGTGPALPFLAGFSSLAQSDALGRYAPAMQEENDGTGTMFVSLDKLAAKAIPFEHQGHESKVDHAPPSPFMASNPVPFVSAVAPEPSTVYQAPYANERIGWSEPVVAPETPAPIDVESAQKDDVAPPPMIGPLATAEMVANTKAPVAKEEALKPEPPTPPSPPAPVEKEWSPSDFPLERCAAVTASIARRKADKAKILEQQEISADQWAAIEKHWADAIRDETKRRKKTLLDRFDTAYVEQLEKERGRIEVEDYAKLMVAVERGTTADELERLEFPQGALMHIERIWMKRMVKEQGLGDRIGEIMGQVR